MRSILSMSLGSDPNWQPTTHSHWCLALAATTNCCCSHEEMFSECAELTWLQERIRKNSASLSFTCDSAKTSLIWEGVSYCCTQMHPTVFSRNKQILPKRRRRKLSSHRPVEQNHGKILRFGLAAQRQRHQRCFYK